MTARGAPQRPAAAILAGGRASRMGGRSKSSILVEGRRIIDRQLDVLHPLVPDTFSDLLIVANDPAPFAGLGLPVIPDVEPGLGPLVGVLSALLATPAPSLVAIACDMPYLSPAVLRLLADPALDADAVVPFVAGYPEPLLARWSRTCIPAIRSRLARRSLKTADLLSDLSVHLIPEPTLRSLDPDLRTFVNINEPSDVR